MTSKVTLVCVKQGSKLRIRFHSFFDAEGKEYKNSYDNSLNCQFPKSIRREGAYYEVGPNDVQLVNSGRTPFYRIGSGNIRIVSSPSSGQTSSSVSNIKTFCTVTECVICMESLPSLAFAPCGHVCTCPACYEQLKTAAGNSYRRTASCPLCRREVNEVIHISKISKPAESDGTEVTDTQVDEPKHTETNTESHAEEKTTKKKRIAKRKLSVVEEMPLEVPNEVPTENETEQKETKKPKKVASKKTKDVEKGTEKVSKKKRIVAKKVEKEPMIMDEDPSIVTKTVGMVGDDPSGVVSSRMSGRVRRSTVKYA